MKLITRYNDARQTARVVDAAGKFLGPGFPGKSAYQVWLDEDNTGTVDDFFDDITAGAVSATAADRVQTGLDRVATGEDRAEVNDALAPVAATLATMADAYADQSTRFVEAHAFQ